MVEEINQPKLLLVEGLDDHAFFKALFNHLNISDIQVQKFDGNEKLRLFLGVLINAPNFELVKSIGIVRDAEQNSKAAFDEICYALEEAGLAKPEHVGTMTVSSLRTGIYLLPNLESETGMLEDLCLQMLNAEPALICVEQYFQCLRAQDIQPPRNLSKAKLTTFLASRPELRLRMAYTMNQDYWTWNHPCLDPLKEFLQAL
ncbi:MAG: DUF3226 domain-containing protein [Cyanobacteria bacterium P01_C01_bin.118]